MHSLQKTSSELEQEKISADMATLQESMNSLQAKIEPARAKVQKAIDGGDYDAVQKYGTKYKELGDKIRALETQIAQLQEQVTPAEIATPSEIPPINPAQVTPAEIATPSEIQPVNPAQVTPAEIATPSETQPVNPAQITPAEITTPSEIQPINPAQVTPAEITTPSEIQPVNPAQVTPTEIATPSETQPVNPAQITPAEITTPSEIPPVNPAQITPAEITRSGNNFEVSFRNKLTPKNINELSDLAQKFGGVKNKDSNSFKFDNPNAAYSFQTAQEISKIPNENLREAYRNAGVEKYPALKILINDADKEKEQKDLKFLIDAGEKWTARKAIGLIQDIIGYGSSKWNKIEKIDNDVTGGKISAAEGYNQAFNLAYDDNKNFLNLLENERLKRKIRGLYDDWRIKKYGVPTGEFIPISSKANLMVDSVSEGFTSANEVYDNVQKMLFGNEEEKAAANNFYENLKQRRTSKLKSDYDAAVSDGTYQKILEKFPELEKTFSEALKKIEEGNIVSGKKDLDEFVEGGEEYQAKVALNSLDSKLNQKHGKAIRQAALWGDENKWGDVSKQFQEIQKNADAEKISYVEAYKKGKQILQDAGLEEGLSDEEKYVIERQKDFEELDKIISEVDAKTYNSKLPQLKRIVTMMNNDNISSKDAIQRARKLFGISDSEKEIQPEMTVGNLKAVDAFKVSNEGAAENKIDAVLNKVIEYRGENMPRRELVERIAKGEISESAMTNNVTAQNYLSFLKGNLPRGIEAIKKAGLEQEKNSGEGNIIESGENSAAYVSKTDNPTTLENLKKLAETFGGNLKTNSKGNPVFEFDTQETRYNFNAAADIFLKNQHLKYFSPNKKQQPAQNAQTPPAETAPAETKQPAQNVQTPPAETAPAETKQPAQNVQTPPAETAPAETKQPAQNAKRKPTGIFGTSEEESRKKRKEAFKDFDFVESLPGESKNFGGIDPNDTVPADKFVDVFDDSEEAEDRLWDTLEEKFNKISALPMFDPEVWVMALKIGGIYIQRGINKFADWAKALTDTATAKKTKEFADKLKVWQPAIWEMLQTMPKIDKFNDNQIASLAERIGFLYDNGITDFTDIRADFVKDFGEKNTVQIEPMIQATYNGVKKFFETLESENKQNAQSTESAPQNSEEIIQILDDSEINEFTDKFEQALQEYKEATAKYIEALQPDNTLGFEEVKSLRNKVADLEKNMRKVIDELFEKSGDALYKKGYDYDFEDKVNGTKNAAKMQRQMYDEIKGNREKIKELEQKRHDKEIEIRAQEALKAAGLEGKKGNSNFNAEISEDNKTVRLRRKNDTDMLSDEEQQDINALIEKYKGVKAKKINNGKVYSRYDFQSGIDAAIFAKALDIYFRSDKKSEKNPAETKKAAVKVTGDEFGEYADIKELRKKAIDYYRKNLQGTSVINAEVGKIDIDENGIVEFTSEGREKVKSNSAQEDTLLLIKYLPELISNAKVVEKMKAVSEKHIKAGDSFYYLKTKYQKGDAIIPLEITLKKLHTGDIHYYNHVINPNAKKVPVSLRTEPSKEVNVSPAVGTFSNKNIAQPAENDNTEIERRAREALKAAGLENNAVPVPPSKYIISYPVRGYKGINSKEVLLSFAENVEPYFAGYVIDDDFAEAVYELAHQFNFTSKQDIYSAEYKNYTLEFTFESEREAETFAKALELYLGDKAELDDGRLKEIPPSVKAYLNSQRYKGENQDESSELGQGGSIADGYKDVQSEVRTATSEERQESGNTSTENLSGQERQTLQRTEGTDTGTNAESSRPVSTNGAGESSARVGTGNGERGSKGVVQPAAGDERGRSDKLGGLSENVTTSLHNFRITEDNSEIGSGGLKTKFKQNIEAIKLLKKIESEGRFATPEEQDILAQFNGWGTLADAFTTKEDWANENKQLSELLTKEEYNAAHQAITNAFYTSPQISLAIWQGLQRLGFKGGRILDPSMGSGIFFGTMPAEFLKNSELTGIELDDLSGRIAKQLYQKAAIDITGFQERKMPDNYFDLAITNVPFSGQVRPFDPAYKKQNYLLHNFFFAKAMDKVRPGGFVAFITSTGTMQADSAEANQLRAEINSKADLIAAFKLPSNTFDKNAGTQVTTDVLILQKRLDKLKPSEHAQNWQEIGLIDAENKSYYGDEKVTRQLPVNEYFLNHSEHMIGKPIEDTMYGEYNGRLALDGKGVDVAKELSDLMAKLPENIFVPLQPRQHSTLQNTRKILADFATKNFSFTVKEGKLYQNQNGELVEVPKNNKSAVSNYLKVMKAVDNLLNAQLTPETTDEKLSALRQTLNRNYDNFVDNHGYINSPKNVAILGSDPNYGRVAAIENYKEDKKAKTEAAEKADIFFKRTVGAIQEPKSTDTVIEALYTSLSMRGFLDMNYMQQLTGKTEDELVKELGDLIYKNPETNLQELAEEYLSGNVREKLSVAQEAAKTNPEFKRNVDALEKIQPQDFNENQIKVYLGSPWVDKKYYEDFAKYILDDEWWKGEINFSSLIGEYYVEGDSYSAKNLSTWAVPGTRWDFLRLLEAAMNRKNPRVTYKDEKGNILTDEVKTAAVRQKIEEIKQEFDKWIWTDDERKKDLLQTYNIKFNSNVLRQYDGSHLKVPGLALDIQEKLYPHQKDAIWRTLQGGNVLIAHAVGAGKTLEMVISGMEKKRTGQIRKPMYIVPNNIVKQFEREFLQSYPSAKLLILDSNNLPIAKINIDYDEKISTTKNTREGKEKKEKAKETVMEKETRRAKRRKTLSRIATEDWDGIIISHETFKRLPMSPKSYNEFYLTKINELNAEFQASQLKKVDNWRTFGGRKPSDKQYQKKLQAAIANLKEKLKRNLAEDEKEIVIPFEELGIDQVFIDEADCFKNLGFNTQYSGKDNKVVGVSTANSQRSLDMYLKTKWLTRQRNSGGVIFATGTPISNTLNEIYTMLRYLHYDKLVELGIEKFDNFARTFAEEVSTIELSPGGEGYRVVKRLKLTNLPVLGGLFREVADIKMAEDLPHLKIPKLKGNDYTRILIKQPPALKKFLQEIAARAQAIRAGKVKPNEDNMLKITGELRKASLDMRLIDPTLSDEEAGGKINALCDTVFKKFKDTTDIKGAQLVFLDLSTPKGKADTENENSDSESEIEEELDNTDISVYERIRNGLIKRGIPKNQIAFVHDAKTKEQRQALFDKVNEGEIRVILGSTGKMGAGTNFQKHLVALHHLDCPWRPRDIEQREGRILRAGNMNEEVEIFQYITEDSGDAFMIEKVKNKAEMISAFMHSDPTVFELEDINDMSLKLNEALMIADSNPLLRERVQVQQDLEKLKLAQKIYIQEQTSLQADKNKLEKEIPAFEYQVKNLKLDAAEKIETKGDAFQMKIGDTVYEKRTDADSALKDLLKDFKTTTTVKIGEIGGFDIKARAEITYANKGGVMESVGSHVYLQLTNHGTYSVETSIKSMEHFISKGIETTLADSEKLLAQDKEKFSEVTKQLAKPFDKKSKLDAATRKLKEIDAKIKGVDQNELVSYEYSNIPEGGEETYSDAAEKAIEKLDAETESAATAENKNTYAEIKNKFPDVRFSFDRNNRAFCTIDGKRVSEEDARKVAGAISNAKTDFILDSLKNDTGITPKTGKGGNNVLISFDSPTGKFVLQSEVLFENLEDAVKAARYIKGNFDDIAFINVSENDNSYYTVFRINEGGERFYTAEVKEKIAKIDAVPNENISTENPAQIETVSKENFNAETESAASAESENNSDQDIFENELYAESSNIAKLSTPHVKETTPPTLRKVNELDRAVTENITNVAIQAAKNWVNRHVIIAGLPEDDSETTKKIQDEIKNELIRQKATEGALVEVDRRNKIQRESLKKLDEIIEKLDKKDKKSVRGEVSTEIKEIVPAEKLNSKQAAISEFSAAMGVAVTFFKGDKRFHGAFRKGRIYLNADSETSYDWTFWHESFHWMAAKNPALLKEISKNVGITETQISNYRTETGRKDLTDAETVEEILADNMQDVASRAGLFQEIGKKNKTLVQRLISWLKSVLDKFTDFFNTPKLGLTREQKNKIYDAFGKMSRTITDAKGNAIFRFNNRTKTVELANGDALPDFEIEDGENLLEMKLSARDVNDTPDTMTAEEIQRNIEKGRAAIQKIIKNQGGKVTAAMHREDIGDIDILWGWKGDPENNFKKGYGISHILARRDMQHLNGELVAQMMPDVIMKGNFVPDKDSTRIQLEYNGYTAILSKTWQGTPSNNWLLTGFVNAKTESPSERGEVYDSTAPTARTPTRFQRTRADDSVSSENISQFEDDGNTKYSINASDNSITAFGKKLANKFFGERQKRFRLQMQNTLEEITGYKIASGHLESGEIAVKPAAKVIRTQNKHPWENTPEFLPAVGKIVAEKLNLTPSEKMNNYIASWILDGAINNTSAESKEFQRAMQNADSDYREKLLDAQSKFLEWENKSAMEQLQEIVITEREEKPLGKKFQAARKTFYSQFFEDIAPIKNLVDEIEKETGKKLLNAENPYIAFRNYKGMAGRAKMILEGNATTTKILQETYPNVNFNGFKTLQTILEEVGATADDKIYDEFSSYVTACHLKEIHEKNKVNLEAQEKRQNNIDALQQKLKSADEDEIAALTEKLKFQQNKLAELKRNFYVTPFSEKKCDEIISQYSKKYGAAKKDLVRFSNTLLAIITDSGLRSQFVYEGLLKKWKNYVPLHRLFDENENLSYGDSLKTMEGSARDIIDPIQAIIESTNSFIKRAEKNKAKILLANLTRCNGVGNLIEEVEGKKPDDRTTITFYEDGVKKYLQTDESVVKAVNNLTIPQINWFSKFLRIGTTIVRNFMTLLNPNFAVRNWARDAQDAFIYGGKYDKDRKIFDIAKEIIQVPLVSLKYTLKGLLGGRFGISKLEDDEIFQEWMIHGGAQASFWSMDRNYTQASIEKLTRGRLKNAPPYVRIKDKAAQALQLLQMFGEYSEIGTRIGHYKKVKEILAKRHGGKNIYEDLVTAAYESRDLMDFARGGSSSRTWNILTAFANAHLQGFDKFRRTFSTEKLKTPEGRKEFSYSVLRLIMSSVIPALFLFLLNHDEDWYKKDLNDWERRSHWILGENVRVPKGMDFGTRFTSNLTEDFLNWATDNKKVNFTETFLNPLKDEMPDMLPTMLQPILEASINYDMFTKNPVVPRCLQGLPEHLQYDDRTPSLAKYLGEKLDYSPKKIEHILFGFTGNLGKGAMRVADTAVGEKPVAAIPADWLPLIGGFFRIPYRNPKIINEYYEQLDAQTKLYNEFKLTGKKPEGFDEKLLERMKKVQKEMKKFSQLELTAVENPNLDSAEKDRRQIVIQKKRIALVEKVMQ